LSPSSDSLPDVPRASESIRFHPFEASRWPEPLQTLCGWPWVGPLETGVQVTLFHPARRSCGTSDSASSSLAAFVVCAFPPHLSARGKPRDLRDLSPISTEIRLYYAPFNSAPDVLSSQHRGDREPGAVRASGCGGDPCTTGNRVLSVAKWKVSKVIVCVVCDVPLHD
jgi:hypothetical protein